MPANVALAAELAITNTNLTALAARVGASETAIKKLIEELDLDEAAIARLVAAITPAPVVIPPPPTVDPQVLWRATHEAGNLLEWSEATISGAASVAAVRAADEGIQPGGGIWVLKQSVTGAAGGARMQRYPEIEALARAGTPFWYSFKAYFPGPVSFGIYDMFQIISINSVDPSGVGDPIWGIFLTGSGFMPQLGWSPNNRAPVDGPHTGETGKRFYPCPTPIPVGSWVLFEIYLKPAADFTGALQVYMSRNLIFDLTSIKTMHPVGAALPQWIDKDAYGSGLTPIPYSHYVDDVSISLSRMPA